METKRPDVMIIDTDTKRIKTFRRQLRDARPALRIHECTDPKAVHQEIINHRPTVALLHTTFPYSGEGGSGLMEALDNDFRAHQTGVILVLPISGSQLYRSGCQEGLEFLNMANDLVTTDLTTDMFQSVVLGHLDRRMALRAEREAAIESATEAPEVREPAYAFTQDR